MPSSRHLFDQATQALQSVCDAGEARNIAFLLLKTKFGLGRAAVLAGKLVEQTDETAWLGWLARLQRHEPIQYVLEEAEFCGRKFQVNASVLIPRPETEELVAWAAEAPPAPEGRTVSPLPCGEGPGVGFSPFGGRGASILDIGTGSGCIAVTLAKQFPLAEVWAVDVSAGALAVARRNAEAHGVAVHFVQADFLSGIFPVGFPAVFNLVVSNPPYVMLSEKPAMQRNVVGFEPATALFVPDNDPLVFYRHIARFCQRALATGGKYYVETNENLTRKTARLMETHSLSAEVRHDMFGKPRFVGGGRTT